jgi:hypothetical protein
MSTAPPLKIDKDYLKKVQSAFELLLQEVKDQINGIGMDGGIMIPAVSANLNEYFSPGGAVVKGVTGTYSLPFVPAADLYTQLGTMGSSIGSELHFLEKILQDIISGITTTLNNFGTAEDINEDSVDHLLQEFKSVVADLNNPPGSSSTGPGQGTPQ